MLFGVSFLVNPWDYRISLNDDFHIGLLNGNIVFFNDAEYGPYRGSIIGLVDENGNVFPPLEREVRWGYTLGIYYRHFRWADSTLWTLNVLLLWPIAVFGITTRVVWLLEHRRKPSKQPEAK